MSLFRLIYKVPLAFADTTKTAIFATGAGTFPGGKYAQVAYETPGKGQFVPVAAAGATPHTGEVDQLTVVDDVQIEVLCVGEDVARNAVAALKSTHPYEVVDYFVLKQEDF